MESTPPSAPQGTAAAPVDQAFGFNGTLAAVLEAANDRGAYKVLLVRRDGRSTLPVVLFGRLIREFEQGGWEVGAAIRVYGPFKGYYTLDTAEWGRLDVQALRGTWLGRPDPSRFKPNPARLDPPHAETLPPIEQVHAAHAHARPAEPITGATPHHPHPGPAAAHEEAPLAPASAAAHPLAGGLTGGRSGSDPFGEDDDIIPF